MSNFSTFDVKQYSLNQKIGEKIWMLAGTGLDASSYISGKVIKSGLTYLQADYPELFNIVGHGEVTTVFYVRTSGTTSTISVIAYVNDIYVYGGFGGVLATSTDAVTWTARTSGVTETIHSLTYGNGIYVYGGGNAGNSALRTSTDAITWTARTSGTTSTIRALVYNNLYVYVADGGIIGRSTDAVTWTTQQITANTLLSLIYAGNIYVCAGHAGYLATSTDAVTWTARTSGTTSTINTIIYGNGIYVCAGNSGSLLTSTDAVTWTARTSGIASTIFSLVYRNGLYTYAGNGGVLLTSTDAITWTQRSSGTSLTIYSITYGKDIYVYAGVQGVLRTSTDLYSSLNSSTYSYITQFKVNSFTTTTIAFTSTVNNMASIVGYVVGKDSANYSSSLTYPPGSLLLDYSGSSAPSGYILTGSTYSQAAYPDLYLQLGLINALPWTARTSGTTTPIYTLIYNNGLYVYGGANGALATSTDAVTWTARTSGTAQTINRIAYLNNLYIYVGNIGVLGTSTDAITWTARTSNVTGNLTAVNWDGTKYVVNGNGLAFSTDGTTWSAILPGSTGTTGLESLAYSSSLNRVVGIGYNGLIVTSDDKGQNWIKRTNPSTARFDFVGWFSNVNLFIATGETGTLITSPDGITWTSRTTGTSVSLGTVIWNGTYFLAVVGSSTNLLRSTDGITWTLLTVTGLTAAPARSIANSTITIVYDLSGNVWTSPSNDLTTWTSRGASGSGNNTYCGTYSDSLGLFVIGGEGAIVTSTDGITWTSRRTSPNTCFDIVWTGSYFIICSRSKVIKSTDGVTWTDTTVSMLQQSSITFADSNTVIIGSPFVLYGEVIMRSTDDGANWTTCVISGNVTQIIKNGTDYIILLNDSLRGIYKATSPTGLNGTHVNQVTGGWLDVIFANGLYVACGASGRLHTSTDAITWTARTSGTTSQINALTYGNVLYVYAGSGGLLATSTDAITWTIRVSGTTSTLFALTYGGGLYVYGGIGGVLATSTDAVSLSNAPYNINTEFLVPEVNLGISNHHKVWIKT